MIVGESAGKSKEYLGEYYRACAGAAERGHIYEGSEQTSLLAVSRRDGNERAVCRVIQGEGNRIKEVVGNCQPYHFKRCVFRHGLDKHQHACNRQNNG